MSAADAWWVYLLRTDDDRLYSGMAQNVDRRVKQHRSGQGAMSLRGASAIELVGAVPVGPRRCASRFERRVKRWHRVQRVAYFAENAETWQLLQCRFDCPSALHTALENHLYGEGALEDNWLTLKAVLIETLPELLHCMKRFGLSTADFIDYINAESVRHYPQSLDLVRAAALTSVTWRVRCAHHISAK